MKGNQQKHPAEKLSPLEFLRLYGRLLRFLSPHLGNLIAAVFFMLLLAAFSGFSIAMIVPFSEIVLSGKDPTEIGPDPAVEAAAQAPLSEDVAAAKPKPSLSDNFSSGGSLRDKLVGRFYGMIRGRDRIDTLHRFCIALIIVFLLKNLFWYAQSYLIVRVEQLVIRDIRNKLYDHYQRLSLDYFDSTHSGLLIARITSDVELVKGAIANGFAQLIRQSFLLAAYLLAVLLASWRLFLVAGLVLPPNLWLIDRIGHYLRRASRISQEKMARMTSILSESLQGVRIVKAFNLEGEVVRRFRLETQDYARTLIRMTRLGSLHSPLTEVLGVTVAVAILWVAGKPLIESGAGGTGRFLLFLVGMLSMMQPIKVLSQVNMSIQQGLAAATRIFFILDEEPSVKRPSHPKQLHSFKDSIRYENVTFAYKPERPVLHNITMEIRRGEVLALVGPSGAGKTTLVDLIPRFYDPVQGRLTIDGIDLREVDLMQLRRLLGLVTQETVLFHDSILRNISFGRHEAAREEIENVCHAAHAHEFITELPEGYDTVIGERGIGLSVGQRQRLSIARALLKNPPILILDEATSALDTESERFVQDAITHLLKNRTAIVIAHRLSTIRSADKILVIDQGRVAQTGTHTSLMEEGGLYKRLHDMQFDDIPSIQPLESEQPPGQGV
ncbi:MAG: ABC transporter ATP-binding protein/permease [Candidatus Eisenbacteria bacterium]|nr:ABC transporter ATP-binding protein/permease [Candidatus Eisenbacteria bacterium]MBU1950190.1 ABC transporter ATP-binding protein/permease [Candidatus Eisenbacteria bacterium]